jgi:hypothetical protein
MSYRFFFLLAVYREDSLSFLALLPLSSTCLTNLNKYVLFHDGRARFWGLWLMKLLQFLTLEGMVQHGR